MTLGGQYDWTAKAYPAAPPPPFPADIAALLTDLFPETRPEAAILNFYAPGDTLSMHRDVAESCGKGLISISLGCDGIFVIGVEGKGKGECRTVVVRLRSGDAVYMTGESRFAWHGVPQIVAGTCPEFLRDWPAGPRKKGEEVQADEGGTGGGEDPYERWRSWMAGKRINLNVRQMFE